MTKLRAIKGGMDGGPPKNPRHMSLKQVADLLDRDRNTIMKWLERHGCPYVTKAAKGRGEAWVLDIADVVRWMEARAGDAAAAASIPPAQGPDGEDNSKEEADRRKAWAQALREEQRLAEERGQLIRQDDAIAVVAAEYADVQQALGAIPSKTATTLASMDDPGEIMNLLGDEIRDALSSLKGEIAEGVEAREAADVDED
ncbi:terminase small subunit [Microvirga yunnanensis]|uniref:terminase small subunit n=1 Tax=Microvirga yunnanensis TaxID=2953740 RepID=UPI0021CA5C42|nr:terminase small subunit [Microvirga sp. HBU67655]